MDGVARFVFTDEVSEGARGTNFDAIDGGDDVFILEASFGGGAILDDGGIARWTLKVNAFANWQVVSFGDFGGDFYTVDTEISTLGGTSFN